ncbi:MAG: hypothetical protein EXR98_21415 [Gemmataceae bacterium]|nr:hypothetical protein [Gemmataceae bacterium]
MQTSTVRLGLSLMVAVAFWVNPLRAQQITVVPEVPYQPAYHAYAPPAFAQPKQPAPASHHAQRFLNNHGMSCQTNAFYPTCGNFCYEFRLAFGSCRSFFGESCQPNQPSARKHRQP